MTNSNDVGVNLTNNGGKIWTEQDYITTQLYHVMTTSDVPYHVAGAQQTTIVLHIHILISVGFILT